MNPRDHSDPLSVLHTDDPPVQPDPAFAARLRRQLESALSLPEEGVVMSGTTTAIAELTEPVTPTAPRPAALPYLSVVNARAAIAWYADAFGAVVVGDPIVMDDGRIGHAEIAIDDGVLYLADEYPELGLKAPAPSAVSVSLMLHVADTDAALQRAREHGATVEREIYENYGTRNATIVDPFGHRWMLSGPSAVPSAGIRHGDIGYVSVWTPDADRAAAFYGHVLGWTYDPASHRVTNTDLPTGIFATDQPATLFCCYAVADVQAARIAIAEAGGVPGETRDTDYGVLLDATDPQGAAFAVHQPTPGRKRPELNGSGPGELSVRHLPGAGFGRVPRFLWPAVALDASSPAAWPTAGRWWARIRWPAPPVAASVPSPCRCGQWPISTWRSTRVREAGGTVLAEPARQPYGVTAECTDDQGARFYLGEF